MLYLGKRQTNMSDSVRGPLAEMIYEYVWRNMTIYPALSNLKASSQECEEEIDNTTIQNKSERVSHRLTLDLTTNENECNMSKKKHEKSTLKFKYEIF